MAAGKSKVDRPKQVMKPVKIKDSSALKDGTLYYAQPKVDGWRFHIKGGKILTFANKEFKNPKVQEKFGHLPEGWEGELYVGSPHNSDYQRLTSLVSKRGADLSDVRAVVFDCNQLPGPYGGRLFALGLLIDQYRDVADYIHYVPFRAPLEANSEEAKSLPYSKEGLILRAYNGAYKWGRSTIKENTLFALKFEADEEAEVLEVHPMMHNKNEAKVDESGRTVRSSKKAGKVVSDPCGSLTCKNERGTFRVGLKTKADTTREPKYYVGKTIVFKYNGLTDAGLPRHAVYKGIREEEDR